MNFFFLRFTIFLTVLLLSFSGCSSSDGTGRTIRYDIEQGVSNLDPQFATDETARMIISNTFEGLFRLLPDGSVQPALAKNYTVSDDGLVYTFQLREDAFWSAPDKEHPSEPVTAHDFVFAFRRLFQPDTASPFASSLLSISNAEEILNGTAPVSSLGVEALDSGTVRISLKERETMLPSLLANTYAMPCREAFFNSTRGRYGLSASTLIFNGPFKIQNWDNESAISLRKNSVYYGTVIPFGVTFSIPSAIAKTAEANFVSDPIQRFLNGTTDACKIDYELTGQVAQSGGTITSFEDTVWVLALNNDPNQARRFSSLDIRQAVAFAVDRSLFARELPENMSVTSTLIPPAIPSNGRSFREIAGNAAPLTYSPDLARRAYRKGMDDLQADSLAFGQILICDDPAQGMGAGYLQRTLQQYLASPIGITTLSREELMQRVRSGDYAAAVIPLTADHASPDAIFSYFRSDSFNNFTSFQNSRFDNLLQSLSGASAQEQEEIFSQAEQLLLTECPVIPLFYETSYYGAAEGVSGIDFAPFLSGMRFENARKTS